MALKYEKISWIAVSVTVLFVTIYFFDGEENSDIGVFLATPVTDIETRRKSNFSLCALS